MEDNEDEPEDVRKATPVEQEIKKGAVDEDSGQPTKLPETTKKRHHCEAAPKKKLKEKSEGECCRAREAKAASKEQKYATVLVYEKKCVIPKLKAVPRHCITKQEWIDSLATPSRRCPSPCLQKSVTRRVRPVSARMAELGQPPKQRMINTLQAKAGILPIEMVDKLIQRLETETCISPEQAEKMYRDKNGSKKKCPKTKKMKAKCEKERSKGLEAGISSSGSPFDREAVNCQYAMAESFVKSILDWECPIPREEFKDIADVILKRLSFLLEYELVNGEDRKSQQMRFLADVIGSWISGVLFEVAEVRKTELEEECERRKKGIAEESEEESDDESQDDYPSKYDDDDDDDDDDEKPDDGSKPEGDEQDKEKDKRPISRGFRGFRFSKDKDDKDDDDKDKGRKSSKKVSGESEKVDLDDGKRKSSDDDKFYDARTGESQDIGEKKTPMKEPGVAEDELPKDVTAEKAPGAEEGPEVIKEGDERRRTEDKLEKDESLKEKGEKGLEAEELPVTSTEKRQDEFPEKAQQPQSPQGVGSIDDQDRKQSGVVGAPEVPKTIDGPEAVPPGVDTSPAEAKPHSEDSSTLATLKEAIPDAREQPAVEIDVPEVGKVAAAESDRTLSTEQSRPSKQVTTKPEAEILDPETTPILSEEKPQEKKESDGKEERKESAGGTIKSVGPSAELSEKPATITPTPEMIADPMTQSEEKLQVPRTSLGDREIAKPEVDTERVIQQVPKIDQRPELPEVSAESRPTSTEKAEIPKASVGDMESKEIVAQDDKMLEPSTLLDPDTGKAEATPEVTLITPEAAVSKPEAEVTEKRPEMSQTAVEMPQAPKEETPTKPEVAESKTEIPERSSSVSEAMSEEPSIRPEVIETRPETISVVTESKVEELKKTSKDSAVVVPTKESWDKVQPEESDDEERRRILGSSIRRSSESADHLKAELADPKEKKEPKEHPHGLVVDKKFRTDTPFVTFDKIFHTIYNAIENNEENSGDDPVTNRIHRAVYEKCSNIVQEEKPGQLSELTKDVLDVMFGKIAIWLKNILTESQMNFVDRFPATVESTEVREWTSWISLISNTADDWSNWIQRTIREAETLSNRPITRRDWNDWTENVDSDALKWRRFYLESLHQAHQNLTMIRDRQVVKTGTKRLYDHNDENEKEVTITDLEDERQSSDRSS